MSLALRDALRSFGLGGSCVGDPVSPAAQLDQTPQVSPGKRCRAYFRDGEDLLQKKAPRQHSPEYAPPGGGGCDPRRMHLPLEFHLLAPIASLPQWLWGTGHHGLEQCLAPTGAPPPFAQSTASSRRSLAKRAGPRLQSPCTRAAQDPPNTSSRAQLLGRSQGAARPRLDRPAHSQQ